MLDQKRLRNRIIYFGLRRAGLSLLVLFTLGSLGAAARALLIAEPRTDSSAVVMDSAVSQGNERKSIEAETITLSPTGFHPAEITRSRGPFLLTVSNRSGLEEVVIRLSRGGADRLREAPVSRKRKGWRDVINLPPGQYILSEANHPDWICTITINAE